MKYEELKMLVCQWAEEKGITEKATPLTQWDKMMEEVIETRDALVKDALLKENGYRFPEVDKEVTDGIGDIFVTLIILSLLAKRDPVECLEYAWNQIKDRTGEMVNGQFVKDQ